MTTSGAHTRLTTSDYWPGTNGAYDDKPIGVTSRDYITGTDELRASVDRMLAEQRRAIVGVAGLSERWNQHKRKAPAILGPPMTVEPAEQHSVRHGPAIQLPEQRLAPITFHEMNGVA